jgi:hypothetical protein
LPNYRNELVKIDCDLMDETEKAWLIVDSEGEEYWVPKSISEWHPDADQVSGEIEVPTWWAEKEGLA